MNKLKIRVEVEHTDNVFHVDIVGYKGNAQVGVCRVGLNRDLSGANIRKMLDSKYDFDAPWTNSFEVVFNRDVDYLVFSFTEHLENKIVEVPLEGYSLTGVCMIGAKFYEKQDKNDSPTYAGDKTFFHPIIEGAFVPYLSIDPQETYEANSVR